jgi:hypothetical protein
MVAAFTPYDSDPESRGYPAGYDPDGYFRVLWC